MSGDRGTDGSSPATAGSTIGPEISFSDVTTTLGDDSVLHRLRLDIPSGEVTVLMGASGSGKTTLVRHLVGLLRPDSGVIRVGDRSVWDQSPKALRELRAGMGVLLGGSLLFDSSVFGSLTVFENVAYPLRLRGDDENAINRTTGRWLRSLWLEDEAARLPEELPAHTRRRMALARALVADPPLIVLDDIDLGLGGGPVATRVVSVVTAAQERTGATMVITTHNIELARAVGKRLAILANGRIVASGPTEVLLDGVRDATDFDTRFRVRDSLGPPTVGAPEAENRRWTISFDPQVVATAIVCIVIVMICLALFRELS